MAKKKSFTIGNSLAQALGDTVSAAQNYTGELHIEVIPLRKIELDLNNPRELVLTANDLHQAISPQDPFHDRKIKEREALTTLANSIKEQGIINPIIVYKHGENYRLVAGERRTLASILACKKDIQAKVLMQKPNPLKLSLLQWIENIERSDLSLWERVRNIEKIIVAYATEHQKSVAEVTATDLSQLLGCSLQQAVNYKNVINASPELRSFIQKNQLKNLEKASFLAKLTPDIQAMLIEACIQGSTLKELKSLAKQHEAKKHKEPAQEKNKRGRQAIRINFGATKHLNVAKLIIESIITNRKFSYLKQSLAEINWTDYQSVTEFFQFLIKKIEEAEIQEVH